MLIDLDGLTAEHQETISFAANFLPERDRHRVPQGSGRQVAPDPSDAEVGREPSHRRRLGEVQGTMKDLFHAALLWAAIAFVGAVKG